MYVIACLALAMVGATALDAQSTARSSQQTMAIPVVARVQGSNAFFTSRITLYADGGEDTTVVATYTPRADRGGPARTAELLLPGGSQLEVIDPLASWFGLGNESAVGSLMLELQDNGEQDGGNSRLPAHSVRLLAHSVVFARNGDGSELGQLLPALGEDKALTAGQVGYLASTVDALAYRVNLGLMGLQDGTRVLVTPEDPIGTPLAAALSYDLDRGSSIQLNDIFKLFALARRNNIVAAVAVSTGKALAYASILDGNRSYAGTNDPTTHLPVTTGVDP